MKKKDRLHRSFWFNLIVSSCGIANTLIWPAKSWAAETINAKISKPNIVFILADDYSMNLIPWMQHSRNGTEVSAYKKLVADGANFSQYFVTNSLCCPSRSTIFTGKYSHNTGVFNNVWEPEKGNYDGGFEAFNYYNNQLHTFAIALQNAGYNTAMLGKYLNGYRQWGSQPYNQNKAWTKWGWDEWHVAGDDGYWGYNYYLNENGIVTHYGIDEKDYFTDNISGIAQNLIKSAKRPFFIEIATYAPHFPHVPAYRDNTAYPSTYTYIPRDSPYGVTPDQNAPQWLRGSRKLSDADKVSMDVKYQLRARSVRSIDKLIYDIRAALKQAGVEKNTYIFFSSDNGYHMGEYGLGPDKKTPFDTDIHVPLVVVGPGVKHQNINRITQSVDLAPTFTEIGGQSSPTKPDGRSLLGLLQGQQPAAWRKTAFVEHHGVPDNPADPDTAKNELPTANPNPPDYSAIRSKDYLYVEYYNDTDCPISEPHCEKNATEMAYYDLVKDPQELKNVYYALTIQQKQTLQNKLEQNKNCGKVDAQPCWQVQQ
jgi:arylsulfatase A-like enzyme